MLVAVAGRRCSSPPAARTRTRSRCAWTTPAACATARRSSSAACAIGKVEPRRRPAATSTSSSRSSASTPRSGATPPPRSSPRTCSARSRCSIDARQPDATRRPTGYTLPTAQVRETTDLDQLLSTLDPDTRTRLAILINETGTAFAGRKLDFKPLPLRRLRAGPGERRRPARAADARQPRARATCSTTSDRYVGALARERRQSSAHARPLGRTTETVAARRAELRETLRDAPGALALDALRSWPSCAGPPSRWRATARLLSRTAPSLQTALERIEPFRRAATPALAGLRDRSPRRSAGSIATAKHV